MLWLPSRNCRQEVRHRSFVLDRWHRRPDGCRRCDSRWGTTKRAAERGMSAKQYLAGNNSCFFFRKPGDPVFTGPTGTNVNDAPVAIIRPPTTDSSLSGPRKSLQHSVGHAWIARGNPAVHWLSSSRRQDGRRRRHSDVLPGFTFCESPRRASSSRYSCRRASSWTACSRQRLSYSATCTPAFRTQRRLLRRDPCKLHTSPFASPLVSLAQRAHGGTTSSPCEVVGAANGAGLVQMSRRLAG